MSEKGCNSFLASAWINLATLSSFSWYVAIFCFNSASNAKIFVPSNLILVGAYLNKL